MGDPNNQPSMSCGKGDGLQYFCRTMFEITLGSIAVVQRGCYRDTSPNTRELLQEECSAANHAKTISCYYTCQTNNCNNITLSNLKSCLGNCSSYNGHGHCDYTTGLCVCSSGWSGRNCDNIAKHPIATVSYRSCVQCSQLTDPDCVSKTLATKCPAHTGMYNYCVTTKTTIFHKESLTVLSEDLTRGCINSHHHNDRCTFSSSSNPESIAYTCTSSCGTDGCNTRIPDGQISGDERTSTYCLVCEDDKDNGSCARGETQRVRCRHSESFCKSTVTYFISKKNDLSYQALPVYKFGKIVRSCSKKPVTRNCKTRHIGLLNAKQVTCKETCDRDGCNDGWPARPKCAQCESGFDKKETNKCRANLSLPKKCSRPFHQYCIAIERKIKSNYTNLGAGDISVFRGCSFHSVSSDCRNITVDGVAMLNCNKTCDRDGCNFDVLIKAHSGSSHLPRNRFIILLSTFLTFCVILLLN